MHPDQRSRRRLLGGLLSSILGWLWLGKAKADAPPPVSTPAQTKGVTWMVVTVHFTDRHGQQRQVSYEYPDPCPAPDCCYLADATTGLTIVTRPG
jgi:hypothetical protein